METDRPRIAEQIRGAIVHAALEAYEDAAIRGLCPTPIFVGRLRTGP